MKLAERFFRNYFLTLLGIIALFLLLNAVLFFSVLLWSWQTSDSSDFSMSEVRDRIIPDETGRLTAEPELAALLEEHQAWAMVLDDTGTVIFETHMPEELPRRYTPVDVAKFSRWYLEDYPVYVLEHPQGLLVAGGEKGSQVKYYISVDEIYVKKLLAGLAAAFLANILVVVLLIWKNTRHIEKAIAPILRGIETVSSGRPVDLPERGELAEINRQLNQAGAFIAKKDSARADWIAGVSHDVRTPLSVILGFAGQMEDDQALPDFAREQAAAIRRQGEKLRSLIADLNLASRLEYSMQPLRLEKVCPVELARQVVCEFLDGGLGERYSIAFRSEPKSESASITGDEALLKRALHNLIQNSIAHNPEGCDISVAVRREGNGMRITVADNGMGVSYEKLEELRAAVHRIESVDEKLNLRHGLGVLLVRQILEAHHGAMEIDSAPQNGYQTVLTFPGGQI